jgi:starch-binding outer membrane protein, SusD/RagB family
MKFVKIIAASTLVLSIAGCTKLDETFRSEVTSVGGSGGSSSPAALLRSAYGAFNDPLVDQARLWALMEHPTDEAIGPTRGGDWDDNGIWRVLHNHRWNADHDFITATFRQLAQAQFAATAVLDNSPSVQQAAEARFLRALAMYYVLDGWDQVPFRSTTLGDITKSLPETKKGAAAADFLIAELNAAIPGLPSTGAPDVASKNAARALLMKVYLNKGVYTNRTAPTHAAADMNQVITLADQIMGGSYSLGGNYFDAFTPSNASSSAEIIYSLLHDESQGFGGNNRSRWYCTLHYNQTPGGWNGFTTLSDFYDKFEAVDKRRGGAYPGFTSATGTNVGLLVGQQKNAAGANLQDRRGNPLVFTRGVKIKETGNDLEVTGIRVVKYVPDMVASNPANNDYVIFRLTDIAYMKAEAILRGGTGTATTIGGTAVPSGNTALGIVNYIRTHSSRTASALPSITLDILCDERGREFYWEGWRRSDLIRFGKYLQAYQEKPASTSERLLFPIPNEQIAVNPNLSQNPGY